MPSRDRPSREGPYRDVLGDLIRLDGRTALIDTRAGPITIELADVVLSKIVEPSRADQLALEAVAARGWRPLVSEVSTDGWLLRADHGWTGRANSALALRTVRRPLGDVLAEVSAFYERHELPVRISVPLPAAAALDTALASAGWGSVDVSEVLTTRLDLLANRRSALPAGLRMQAEPAPSPAWLAACRYRGGPLPAAGAELLRRHDAALFAAVVGPATDIGPRTDTGQRAARLVAVARGVVDEGWLGITVLHVEPALRRRGIAAALIQHLGTEAQAAGATRAYLQVSADNTAAIAAYRRLGFHRHHGYVYRCPPPTHRG